MEDFKKPPLSYEQQAELLISRGLVCDNGDDGEDGRSRLIRHLTHVNYYHLEAYWYLFREFYNDPVSGETKERFKKDTHFNMIWDAYVFDRRLRLLVMDAIERIEVSVRTNIVNTLVLRYGAFAHYNGIKTNTLDADHTREYHRMLAKLESAASKKRPEQFVVHHKEKYTCFPRLPFWVACELMTFGNWSWLYPCIEDSLKARIAATYRIESPTLESWLRSLSDVRNICAHHGRLWNNKLVNNPKMPKEHKGYSVERWPYFLGTDKTPISQIVKKPNPNRLYPVLCICHYMMTIASPGTGWRERVLKLLREYGHRVNLVSMINGFSY